MRCHAFSCNLLSVYEVSFNYSGMLKVLDTGSVISQPFTTKPLPQHQTSLKCDDEGLDAAFVNKCAYTQMCTRKYQNIYPEQKLRLVL